MIHSSLIDVCSAQARQDDRIQSMQPAIQQLVIQYAADLLACNFPTVEELKRTTRQYGRRRGNTAQQKVAMEVAIRIAESCFDKVTL